MLWASSKISARWALAIAACMTMTVMTGCMAGEGAGKNRMEAKADTGQAGQIAKKEKKEEIGPGPEAPSATPDLYSVEPVPLKPYQCAQCHTGQFHDLKSSQSKHRFECQRCHERFHAYNPVKDNWAEIMPRCSRCHSPPPHGSELTDCARCHRNPHSPLSIPMDAQLLASCGKCHPEEQRQITAFKSAHTEQGCDGCHSAHGAIPSCSDCHDPHYQGQQIESCKGCHPAHAPKNIAFGKEDYSRTCASCHDDVYSKWSTTKSKHGQVRCTECHEAHGQIPQCQKCHGLPHGEALLKRFPRCLDCHIDVHDLPAKP